MSEENRVFRVILCGFSDIDRLVLERILKLSEVRPRRYELHPPGGTSPDLILLNEASVAGEKECNGLLNDSERQGVATLVIGADGERAQQGRNYFVRPILALRLLKKMDDLVTEAFAYAPELAVTDQARIDPVAASAPLRAPCADETGKTLCRGLPILAP